MCTVAGDSVVLRSSSAGPLQLSHLMQTKEEEHLHRLAKVLLEHCSH